MAGEPIPSQEILAGRAVLKWMHGDATVSG